MRWRPAIPWVLLVCEYAVLVCVFGMLMVAGISAGFIWWPIPTTLAVGCLFAAASVFFARDQRRLGRWLLWTLSLVPATYLLFFIARDSWKIAHPLIETWVIPADYHGPIYVVRNVPQGAVATQDRDHLLFVLDDAGIAVVKEAVDSGWVQATYEYRSPEGRTTKIPEAAVGSIEDTPANRQDGTRRVYFPSSGEFEDGSKCSYSVSQAYVESPREALDERSSLQQVGKEQMDIVQQIRRRYPGICSSRK